MWCSYRPELDQVQLGPHPPEPAGDCSARRGCVLPAALDHPHAQHNRADDEQDAQELEAGRVIGLPGRHAGDADRNGKDGNQVLNGGLRSEASAPVRRSASFREPLEQVTGLAVQYPAHCIQGAETNSLGTTVLQHRHVGRREPDTLERPALRRRSGPRIRSRIPVRSRLSAAHVDPGQRRICMPRSAAGIGAIPYLQPSG